MSSKKVTHWALDTKISMAEVGFDKGIIIKTTKTYKDTYTQITSRGPFTEKIPKRADLTKKLSPMT